MGNREMTSKRWRVLAGNLVKRIDDKREIGRNIVHEEAGLATTLTMLVLMFGMLALMLMFVPFFENYSTRRIAQNGADAAAHAGAGVYADALSITWPILPFKSDTEGMASCPSVGVPTVQQVRDFARRRAVELYQQYYYMYVPANMMRVGGEAAAYAQANYAQMNAAQFRALVSQMHPDFNFYHRPSFKTLYPVAVQVDAAKFMKPWSGGTYRTPAAAAAIAFVSKVEATVDTAFPSNIIFDPKTGVPCTAWMTQYRYSWEISIIKSFM